MNIVAIIQARTGSTRLPRKVLADINGHSVLWHVVNRVNKATLIDRTILATTRLPEDLGLCQGLGIDGCFHGHSTDVLDRVYRAAREYGAEAVVRVTGDCPMIDPSIINLAVSGYVTHQVDYYSNVQPPTFPDGCDVEVISMPALYAAWRDARLPSDREHVTPYIWQHPEWFKCGNVRWITDLSHHRWCIDTEADLRFVRAVYAELGDDFTMHEVVALLERRPELRAINAGLERNSEYEKQVKEEMI